MTEICTTLTITILNKNRYLHKEKNSITTYFQREFVSVQWENDMYTVHWEKKIFKNNINCKHTNIQAAWTIYIAAQWGMTMVAWTHYGCC